jgi:hypothetical protein
MMARYQTPDSGSEPRPLAADEWKANQVREIRIDPATEGVGSTRTAFLKIPINAEQIGPGLAGDYKLHPRQLSNLGIPCLAEEFLKIPLRNATFRDILQTLGDLLFEHAKFLRLLK